MANKITNTQYYTAIANALRAKYEDNLLTFTPAQMAAAITNLPTGGDLDGYIDGSLTDIETNATSVKAYCFNFDSTIESFTGPEVLTIGEYAFSRATSLTEINLPKVTSIGNYGLQGCHELRDVSFPDLLTLGDYALFHISGMSAMKLRSFIAPKLTQMGQRALYECADTAFTSISLPECTTLGPLALGGCNHLVTISLPKCTNIGTSAFANDSALVTLVLPTDEYVTLSGGSEFYGCTNLVMTTLPKTTSIGRQTFYNCQAITISDIPATVTSLGQNAFQMCTGLGDLKIRANSIGNAAFDSCTGITKVWLSSDVTTINTSSYTYAPFYNCTNLTDIYCEASSKPSGWGNYFNYKSYSTQATVHYGVSESDFDAIIAE